MSEPYLIVFVEQKRHNPEYDQDAKCTCGHAYYRHFDTYDDMEPVGCKYCTCWHFSPKTSPSKKNHGNERRRVK